MGADGYIRFYDQGKVNKICNEINYKHGLTGDNRVSFPGYPCDFRVNGQPCYVTYWDSVSRKEIVEGRGLRRKMAMDTWHNFDFQYDKQFLRIRKEFEDRCNAEAVLVEEQRVWT